MIKTSIRSHCVVKRIFSSMSKRRVAEIMGKCQGFSEVLIQPQFATDGPSNLGHLKAVCQARTVMVALVMNKHLGLVLQTAKSSTVNYTIAIPLKNGAGQAVRFRTNAPAAVLRPRGKGCRANGAIHSQKLTASGVTINGPFVAIPIDFRRTIARYYGIPDFSFSV